MLHSLMAEDIMLPWEASVESLELRRKFDDDEDENNNFAGVEE